jgi:5-methylcytosine-specific restriction protein A
MPNRAPRACRTSTCPHPAAPRSSYCDGCRQRLGLPTAASSHWANWNRGTSTERGYGAVWRRLRAEVLRGAQYRCVPCRREGRFSVADEVHHIVARADGGSDELDNLEAICLACHRKRTASMAGGRRSLGRT